ncbi:unnamed protein product [Caenorhabditis angaria]|uniref:Centromere protein X n=1 Tax=Caenorhabditis angaria TaxID=860376 RepID=A0A9P1INE8_9PELO|nr:unnamed protein product [Caenorhabditis angaria]
MYIKQNSVKSMIIVARRGKKRANLTPEAMTAFTALINLLVKETLTRCAQTAANTNDKTVTKEHFQRVIAQIMMDFNV